MKAKKTQLDNPFVGTWHIYEMELWNEDYFNMETQAYIEIQPDHLGDFQFGLIAGSLDGDIKHSGGKVRFAFTWEGQDEMDSASGSGWMQLTCQDEVEGLIKIHARRSLDVQSQESQLKTVFLRVEDLLLKGASCS